MGLKTLMPLGSLNRLGGVVDLAGSALRRKLNTTTAINITSLDKLPMHPIGLAGCGNGAAIEE